MKVLYLLLGVVFLSACSNPEQPASRSANRDAATIRSAEILSGDSGCLFVVKPLLPARTITVGGRGADMAGFSSDVIQMAADALKETGGTIILSAGIYDI